MEEQCGGYLFWVKLSWYLVHWYQQASPLATRLSVTTSPALTGSDQNKLSVPNLYHHPPWNIKRFYLSILCNNNRIWPLSYDGDPFVCSRCHWPSRDLQCNVLNILSLNIKEINFRKLFNTRYPGIRHHETLTSQPWTLEKVLASVSLPKT